MSNLRRVCIKIREIHTVSNYLIVTAYDTILRVPDSRYTWSKIGSKIDNPV